MTKSEIDKLRDFVTLFREAILKCDRKLLIGSFRNFPSGSCDYASLLLAKYLISNGFGRFQRILGERIGRPHVWLRQEDILVDITATQFEDNQELVMVTRDHSWHKTFDIVEASDANYESIRFSSPLIYDLLNSSYNEIVVKVQYNMGLKQ